MKTKTDSILAIMKFLFWIIYIALLIETGAILFSFIFSLYDPETAYSLYKGIDLSHLYNSNKGYYVSISSLIICLSALKTFLAFLVIRILSEINFNHPFSLNIAQLIAKVSHVALGAGVVAIVASGYGKWLIKKGFTITQNWGGSQFIFLAGIIFIIAYIFKKGVEIQAENELTV